MQRWMQHQEKLDRNPEKLQIRKQFSITGKEKINCLLVMQRGTLSYLDEEDDQVMIIRKGIVPNMRVGYNCIS